jgi:hypothetical protein
MVQKLPHPSDQQKDSIPDTNFVWIQKNPQVGKNRIQKFSKLSLGKACPPRRFLVEYRLATEEV